MKKITSCILCFVCFCLPIISLPSDISMASSWQLVSSYKTCYKNSSKERKHNIALSSKRISGTILKSGQTLSFNKKVGARTEKNGFKVSKVISGGVYVDGVGGGVCQTSTTLYNSAIRAGLKISEVHPHSLSSSYVPASFDAMVSGCGSDLKITNPLSSPVKISAIADGEYVTVKIYSTSKIIGLKIIPYNKIVKNISPPKSTSKPDTDFENITLEKGETTVFQKQKSGVVSRGYIIYKYMGKTIRVKQIRSDVYIPVREICVYGTREKEESQGIKEPQEIKEERTEISQKR